MILAGGLNSRMMGRNKAFLKLGVKDILDRGALDALRPLVEYILLVTRKPRLYWVRSVRVVFPERFLLKMDTTGGLML